MPRKKKEDAYPRWTPPPVVLPDDDASAIPEMREFAAMVWGEITDVFGNSAYLVSRAVDSLAFMKQARDWVRNLELFVRRMIAVLALSIQLPPARPRTPAARPRPPEEFRRRSGHWMDVQGWHVSFRLTPPVPGDPSGMKRSSDAKPPRRAPPSTAPLYGLARRIEALRRVISDHHLYASRFARTLARVKARDAQRNAPVFIRPGPWAFNPYTASVGQYAINEQMPVLQGMCARAFARWYGHAPEPG
mgnify:CR=1 FL=1